MYLHRMPCHFLSLSQYGKYLTSIITQRVGISHAQPLQNLIEYLIFYQILYVVLGAHHPGAIDESVIWLDFDKRLISRSNPNHNGHTRYPIDSPKCGESTGTTCVTRFVIISTTQFPYLGNKAKSTYHELMHTASHLPFILDAWVLDWQLTRGWW